MLISRFFFTAAGRQRRYIPRFKFPKISSEEIFFAKLFPLQLEQWCIGKGLTFIDNNNVNESCLNRGKLHLNRRGSSYLANNFKKFIESLWESKSSAKVYINSHKHLKTELNDLRSLRIQNPRNIIFSYLNINSIRYKFDNLKTIINENLDILCIAESKIDKSFTTAQFMLPGYHNLDISDRKGGLLVYIKSHLPSRLLKNFDIPGNIQIIPFELNLRKEKWVFMCILEDFNMEPSDSILKTFMQSHNLFNLIKSNTSFKGRSSCIDLTFTNRKFCFKNSSTFETGLSDHHHLIYSILKTTFKKEDSKHLLYRDYKNFNNEYFHNDLINGLSKYPKNYESFENVFVTVLDRHALRKTKILRGNQKPHVDKNLRKTIMKRSELKSKAKRTKRPKDISD